MKKDILLISGIIMLIVLNTVGWLYNYCPPCDCPETINKGSVPPPLPAVEGYYQIDENGDTVLSPPRIVVLDDSTVMIRTEVDTIPCTTKVVEAPIDTIFDDDILFNLQDCDTVFTIMWINMPEGPYPDTVFGWYRPCDEGGHLYGRYNTEIR